MAKPNSTMVRVPRDVKDWITDLKKTLKKKQSDGEILRELIKKTNGKL